MRWIVVAAVAALLLGCTSGPGENCDDCSVAEANAPAPFAQAAAAATTGGQEASNQPTMTDPGSPDVSTTIGRGAGDTTSTQNSADSRSQAGAPSVNQGLVIPASADARTGGGVSPVVASLQGYLDDLRMQFKLAVMQGDAELEQRLTAAIDRAISQMAQAQASANAQTVNNYHFEGSTNTQTVANGSNSGDGQTAIDPRNAEAVAKGIPETVKAAKSAAPSTFPPPAPREGEVPDAPPAGASPAPAPSDTGG